jgi:hypothetical protein
MRRLVMSVGPKNAGPNFIRVIRRCCPSALSSDCMSAQRSADEIVISPVVEAGWHRTAIRQGSRNTSGSTTRRAGGIGASWGDIPTPIPRPAWPARQAGFNPIRPQVNKMSSAQNLVPFRLSAGATKPGTRNSRLWCTLAGGVTFARISQSSDGLCTARKWPSRLRTT